jgi:hypothetical protein
VLREGSALVVDEPTDLSRGANDDVFATEVRSRADKITRIVSIYDHHDALSRERDRPAQKLNWQ